MNVQRSPILIGIIAGLAAAVLVALSAYVSPLFLTAALTAAFIAIFIAGLGYGSLSSFLAVVTTAIALGLATSSILIATICALTVLPAAVLSHLASLGRPASEIGGPEATTAWYPLSDIIMAGAVLTAIFTIGFFMLLQAAMPIEVFYLAIVDQASQLVASVDPTKAMSTENKMALLAQLKFVAPMGMAAIYMLMLFAGFYFAMRILTVLGLNIRPREDIRSSLRMNRPSIGIFLASIALIFTGETLGLIGKSFVGATTVGFLLSGYAIFHEILRQKSWGGFVLVSIYTATFTLTPIMIAIAIAGGLANPRRAVALTPNKPNQTSSNQT